MKKSLIFVLFLGLLVSACSDEKGSSNRSKTKTVTANQQMEASEKFRASVEQEMTLAEVAKVNSISEFCLKQELDVPQYVEHPYTVFGAKSEL